MKVQYWKPFRIFLGESLGLCRAIKCCTSFALQNILLCMYACYNDTMFS